MDGGNMQQKILSGISIGEGGKLALAGAAITQKSPLYDRLASPHYMNPRAFSGAELANFRFSHKEAEKFAEAIAGAAMEIRAEHPGKAGAEIKEAVTASISGALGKDPDAEKILGSRNAILLAIFDVYSVLGMGPELSVGQNHDIAVKVGNIVFSYPDDKSKYRNEERKEQFVAFFPAQACSAVHLILGKEAEQRAQDRKHTGDDAAWKSEITAAIMHYEEAVAFDIGNEPAIYNLSGAYAAIGQHGKAADIYKKAFELSSESGAKAYYATFLAENSAYTKDARRMIEALRIIEDFSAKEPQYAHAREAAEELRAALAEILSA